MTSDKPLSNVTNFYSDQNNAFYTSAPSNGWDINKFEVDDSSDVTLSAIAESMTTIASAALSHNDTTTAHKIITLSDIIKTQDHDYNNFNEKPTNTPYLPNSFKKEPSVREYIF